MWFRGLVVAVFVLQFGATVSWADAPPEAAEAATEDDAPRSIRIYQVGDLLSDAPRHRATNQSDLAQDGGNYYDESTPSLIFPSDADHESGGDSAATGGPFNVRENSQFAAEDATDEFAGVVQSMIAPQSWYAVGGENQIERLGTSLVVSADDKTHAQIADLVAKLRERRERTATVSVRSYWLWLDDEQLAALVADKPSKDGEPRDASRAFGLVEPAEFAKHLAMLDAKDAAKNANGRAGYRIALTCFDGQTASAASGRQSRVVSGFIPVVGDGVNVAFRPVFAIVKEGPILQITPRLATAGDEVVLDIRGRVAVREVTAENPDAKKLGDESFYLGARRMAAMIEGRTMRMHQLATMVRVPLDKPMLVGGMTDGEEAKRGDANLYLFVNVTAQRAGGERKAAR